MTRIRILAGERREQDRRGRSGRAACVRGERAARERAGRGGAVDSRGSGIGRQADDPRDRRRHRDDSRRRAAGVRAARDVEAAHGGRFALDRDARVSRRGAAFDRRGLAPAAANARGRGRGGNARRICGRKTCRRESGRASCGDDDQRGRSFLLRAGAAQFPEVGNDGTRPHRFARHALRARASRQTICAEDADAGNHPRHGGRDDGRARLPAFRTAGARRIV